MPVGGSRAWLWRPWAAAGPGRGARGRQQSLGDTKSARNFPRSLLKTAQKRSNSNDANSNTEIVTGELRAKLLSSRQDGATHSRTSHTAGVEAPEGRAAVPVGGGGAWPGCGARGRRRGLAGLRCPWAAAGPGRTTSRRAEPKARSADGSRAGRRPRAHHAARPNEPDNTAPGTPAAPQATPSAR